MTKTNTPHSVSKELTNNKFSILHKIINSKTNQILVFENMINKTSITWDSYETDKIIKFTLALENDNEQIKDFMKNYLKPVVDICISAIENSFKNFQKSILKVSIPTL